jgi:hypothetical protein
MATDQQIDQQIANVNELAGRIVDAINEATTRDGHPATAITALQFVVARLLTTYSIPVEAFVERVRSSIRVERRRGTT